MNDFGPKKKDLKDVEKGGNIFAETEPEEYTQPKSFHAD